MPFNIEHLEKTMWIACDAMMKGEVPIACIIVDSNDNIMATGHNHTNLNHNPTHHAELIAIEEYIKKYNSTDLSKCSLYVNVEPCIMCAGLINIYEIKRVYFGCFNPKFGGCSSIIQSNHKFQGGYAKEQAIFLLRLFYLQENERSPIAIKKHSRSIVIDDLGNFEAFKILGHEIFQKQIDIKTIIQRKKVLLEESNT